MVPSVPPSLTRQAAQRGVKRLRDELHALGHPLALMPAQDLFARTFGFPDWRTLQIVWPTDNPKDPSCSRPPQVWRAGAPASWASILAFLEREGWTVLHLVCGWPPQAECGDFAEPPSRGFFELPPMTVDGIEAFMAETGQAVTEFDRTQANPITWSWVSPTGTRWLFRAIWSFYESRQARAQPGWQVEARVQNPCSLTDLPLPNALRVWLAAPRSRGLVLIGDPTNAPWSLLETAATDWAHQSGCVLHAGDEFVGQGARTHPNIRVRGFAGAACDASLHRAADGIEPGDGVVASCELGDWDVALSLAEGGALVWCSLPDLPISGCPTMHHRYGRLCLDDAHVPHTVGDVLRALRAEGRARWQQAIAELHGIVVVEREDAGHKRPGTVHWLTLNEERRDALRACPWGDAGHRAATQLAETWMTHDGSAVQRLPI